MSAITKTWPVDISNHSVRGTLLLRKNVSTTLANEHDQHSINVFDPSIKGQTDRFAYRFVKP